MKLTEKDEKAPPAAAGGENRTGEEDEQRILLETGDGGEGEDDCKSSKKFDLLPQTMADMLCLQQEFVSLLFLPSIVFLLHPFFHADPPPKLSISLQKIFRKFANKYMFINSQLLSNRI